MKKKLLTRKLSNVYGIGKKLVFTVLKEIGLNKKKSVTHIKKKQTNIVLKKTKKIIVGSYLKAKIFRTLDFYNKLKTYKSIRHRLHYPCRGQRTRTNAKTTKRIANTKSKHNNKRIRSQTSKIQKK